MRYLKRFLGAAVVLGCSAVPGLAQGGTIVSSGGTSTGSLSGTNGLAGGTGNSSMGANPTSANNNLSSGLSSLSGITAPGAAGGGGGGSSVISTSNFLSGTYGNPYYQGTYSNATSNSGKGVAPGGFGSPTFGNATGGYGGQIGSAAGGAAGRNALGGAGRAGLGGIGGLGGRGGAGSGDPGGYLVQLPVQIQHTAIARFPTMPVATSKLQADVSGMIARTSAIANPAGVAATVDRGIVTLTGTVRDMDEARAVANMIRLTPGVRRINNELNFPKQ
jgi:hypothetical protein